MYHRIVKKRSLSNSCPLCVHARDFIRQLQLLRRSGFKAITFRDILNSQSGLYPLPEKPVIITFDDGYLDTYHIAYPLLRKFRMKAVVFVLGNRLIQTNEWDQENPAISTGRLMSGEQIRIMSKNGIEIGAHSQHHIPLPDLNDEDAGKEILEPKKELEELIGRPVNSFSYPYGAVNDKIKKITKKAGYQFGCGVFTGPLRFSDDLYDIRRIAIHNNTSLKGFSLRMKTPYEFLEWFWGKTKIFINGQKPETRQCISV